MRRIFGKKPVPDFEVYFEDGEVFRHREGVTWDDVPRGRAVHHMVVAGQVLEGYERYGFSWEGVASSLGRGDPRIAVIAVGIQGEVATVVRVPRDGEVLTLDLPVSSIPFAPEAYRP